MLLFLFLGGIYQAAATDLKLYDEFIEEVISAVAVIKKLEHLAKGAQKSFLLVKRIRLYFFLKTIITSFGCIWFRFCKSNSIDNLVKELSVRNSTSCCLDKKLDMDFHGSEANWH